MDVVFGLVILVPIIFIISYTVFYLTFNGLNKLHPDKIGKDDIKRYARRWALWLVGMIVYFALMNRFVWSHR